MPDALEELAGETIEELLRELTPEERLKGLPPEELIKRVPPEERLKGLSAEEVARALTPEVREALARQLKANRPSVKSE